MIEKTEYGLPVVQFQTAVKALAGVFGPLDRNQVAERCRLAILRLKSENPQIARGVALMADQLGMNEAHAMLVAAVTHRMLELDAKAEVDEFIETMERRLSRDV